MSGSMISSTIRFGSCLRVSDSGVAAALGDLDLVALPAEVNAQHIGDVEIVFDDEDTPLAHTQSAFSLRRGQSTSL